MIEVSPELAAEKDAENKLIAIRNAIALEVYSSILAGEFKRRNVLSDPRQAGQRVEEAAQMAAKAAKVAAEVFLYETREDNI